MPYPDSPTVDEIANHPELQRELLDAFNNKSSRGVARIRQICKDNGLSEAEQSQQVAAFFHKNKDQLNLESVGDYLSSPEPESVETLELFASQYAPAMKGQDFTPALRGFLETFRLPGEGQKIDRVVGAFAKHYTQQNPGHGFANEDAIHILTFQAIMLNTDAHKGAVKEKMTFDQLKRNVRGCNGKGDYDETMLRKMYDNITGEAFKDTYTHVPPSFDLDENRLGKDPAFSRLAKEMGAKNFSAEKALGIKGATATVAAPRPWYSFLTGYKSTVSVTDKDGNKVTVEVSKPSIFSKSKPTVSVKPEGTAPTQGSLNLASQITAKFEAPATLKSSLPYVRDDMGDHLKSEKTGVKTERRQNMSPDELGEDLRASSPKVDGEKTRSVSVRESQAPDRRPSVSQIDSDLDLSPKVDGEKPLSVREVQSVSGSDRRQSVGSIDTDLDLSPPSIDGGSVRKNAGIKPPSKDDKGKSRSNSVG